MGVFDVTTNTKTFNYPYAPATQGIQEVLDQARAANQTPWTNFQAGGQNMSQYLGGIGENLTAPMMPGGEGLDFDLVNRVADNPYMNGMIDASLRDSTRQLTEQQLPGLAAYSAGSGNLGSSRRGAAEAIATRGYEDRAADVGSQMRGNAYTQGLGVAERAGVTGLNALNNAAGYHRQEEMLPFQQAQAYSDLVLPIAAQFPSQTMEQTREGDLEGMLLGEVLFGSGGTGGGGGGLIGGGTSWLMDQLGIGGGNTNTNPDGTVNGQINPGAGTVNAGTGSNPTNLQGGIYNPVADTIGDYSSPSVNTINPNAGISNTPVSTAQQPPITNQPVVTQGGTQGGGDPGGSQGPFPGINIPLDPLIPQVEEPTVPGVGATGSVYPGDVTHPDGSVSSPVTPPGGWRPITPELIQDRQGEMAPGTTMADAQADLEASGGLLERDTYTPPNSVQDVVERAEESGNPLTDDEIETYREANPSVPMTNAEAAGKAGDSTAATAGGDDPGMITPGIFGGNVQDGQYLPPGTSPDFSPGGLSFPGSGVLGNIGDLMGKGATLPGVAEWIKNNPLATGTGESSAHQPPEVEADYGDPLPEDLQMTDEEIEALRAAGLNANNIGGLLYAATGNTMTSNEGSYPMAGNYGSGGFRPDWDNMGSFEI